MGIYERRTKRDDAEYDGAVDAVLADMGYAAGVVSIAVAMMHRLSPAQQSDLMLSARKITTEFVDKMLDDNGGTLDYRRCYETRAALTTHLFRKLSEEADQMPEKTEAEILEEVVFAASLAAGTA